MIRCEEGLKQAQYWLAELERSLDGLRQRVQPVNEQKFRLMAEGYVSQIRQLREEIDEYLDIVPFDNQPTLRPQAAVR